MMNKLKAIVRHLWLDVADTRQAIPPAMSLRLAQRVAASEQHHSGQIRICVEASLPASYVWRLDHENTMSALARQRAVMMFSKLRVWDTEHNNGVLIYLLLAERAIEIVADRGLNRFVDDAQWRAMVVRMAGALREQRYEDGLTQALEESSAVLMTHFAQKPESPALANELPDSPLLR